MDQITFAEYNRRLRLALSRYPTEMEVLPNGAVLARLGKVDAPRMGVMSGVHGDERSGPLAVLEWLETTHLEPAFERIGLLVAPLINNLGWDAITREWNGVDLNRSFHLPDAQDFILRLNQRFTQPLPFVFLDLHEDSGVEAPYVFALEGDVDPLPAQVQALLGGESVPWNWEPEWDGSSEVFLRRAGCPHSLTLEVPPSWPLPRRIEMNVRVLNRCLEQVLLPLA